MAATATLRLKRSYQDFHSSHNGIENSNKKRAPGYPFRAVKSAPVSPEIDLAEMFRVSRPSFDVLYVFYTDRPLNHLCPTSLSRPPLHPSAKSNSSQSSLASTPVEMARRDQTSALKSLPVKRIWRLPCTLSNLPKLTPRSFLHRLRHL